MKYRIINAAKKNRANGFISDAVKIFPFEVQTKTKNGNYLTIPGCYYKTKEEAEAHIKWRKQENVDNH